MLITSGGRSIGGARAPPPSKFQEKSIDTVSINYIIKSNYHVCSVFTHTMGFTFTFLCLSIQYWVYSGLFHAFQ